MKQYNPSTDKYLMHNSPEAYLEFLRSNERAIQRKHFQTTNNNTHWGGLPWEESLNKLENGDDSLAAKASEIVKQMDDMSITSIGRNIIDSDVIGFVPNVPAVLSGIPTNMFKRTSIDVENEFAPLTIYIDTSVSSGVANEEIINRGIAVLAFVMAMNTVRPIDLYVTSTWAFDEHSGTACNVVKIPTAPMDLARATWILTAREYVRRFSFAVTLYIAGANSYQDGMPPGWHDYSYCGPTWEKNIRALLNINPEDVVIGGGSLFDKSARETPIQWVREMIKKHTTKDE